MNNNISDANSVNHIENTSESAEEEMEGMNNLRRTKNKNSSSFKDNIRDNSQGNDISENSLEEYNTYESSAQGINNSQENIIAEEINSSIPSPSPSFSTPTSTSTPSSFTSPSSASPSISPSSKSNSSTVTGSSGSSGSTISTGSELNPFEKNPFEKRLQNSSSLFDRYLKSGKIFKNREVLRHSYRPQFLPHRIPEIESIAAILAPAIKNETPSNILIYGKTGTGKTASVKYVGSALEETCHNAGRACNVIFINCEQIDTQYRVLAQIANQLEDLHSKGSDVPRSGIPMTGWPTDQVYFELKNMVESVGGVHVIVLDEIDKLVKKSGDETLYNLTRFNSELKNAKISLIGISNDLRFTTFLDPRVLSSLSEEELVFTPYNAPQLCDILEQRAAMAFSDNSLEEGVIPLCAALAAQEHGDARRALDLLRTSGELADHAGAEKVTEVHVKKAQQKIDTDSLIVCVSTLPTQSKAVLYSMVILAENNGQVFTTGDVALVYRSIVYILDIDVLTNRRINDLISELKMLGIIDSRVVSRGRYGRTKEMWFATGVSGIKNTLNQDIRFDQERLSKIDPGRSRAFFR